MNGDRNAEFSAARGLFVNQRPVSGAALGVLFFFGGVVEGEFDVVEGAEFVVGEDGGAVAVGGDGQFYRGGCRR